MKTIQILLIIFVLQLSYYTFAAEKKVKGLLTFYAFGDNCPPSSEIAYPTSKMPRAGGKGTFDDPITCASSKDWFPINSLVYVPAYKKYFMNADSCEECENEWNDDGSYHIDGWLGSSYFTERGTTNCETELTLDETDFIINPSKGYQVDETPLFANGKCIKPISDPCEDEGNHCGNTCQVPNSISCENAAKMFGLSLERFKALNPKINCSNKISSKKTVCMSGSCGGP